MKELGEMAAKAHQELGLLAGNAGFQQIYFIGEDCKYFSEGIDKMEFKGDCWIESKFEIKLGEKLAETISKGDLIVIKGSRGAETERFISFCKPLNWLNK